MVHQIELNIVYVGDFLGQEELSNTLGKMA
jgi:hypothetical protein